MAQYHVKNDSFLDKAFKVRGGHQIVPAGKEADVPDARELSEAQIEGFAREGVKVSAKGAGKAKEGPPEPTTAAEALALFSAEGVHANTAKAAALKFLGDKVPADAAKDVIVSTLQELAKAST